MEADVMLKLAAEAEPVRREREADKIAARTQVLFMGLCYPRIASIRGRLS